MECRVLLAMFSNAKPPGDRSLKRPEGRAPARRVRSDMFWPVFLLWAGLAQSLAAQNPGGTSGDFEKNIRPLVKQYCLGCHSTEKHKGDLDLERYTSFSEVLKFPKAWQTVTGGMPTRILPNGPPTRTLETGRPMLPKTSRGSRRKLMH